MIQIFAAGGDVLSAPEETTVGYWAALAAGADGLALQVQASKDGKLVCAPLTIDVANMNQAELTRGDAGATFRAAVLDAALCRSQQAEAAPWAGQEARAALQYPALSDVLRCFGRRTSLVLRLASGDPKPVLDLLAQFGLQHRVQLEAPLDVGAQLLALDAGAHWIARVERDVTRESFAALRGKGARQVSWPYDEAKLSEVLVLAAEKQLGLWLRPSGAAIGILGTRWVEAGELRPRGVFVGAVEAAVAAQRPTFEVFRDSLKGDLALADWAAGYSRRNLEAAILPRSDGLHIVVSRGTAYAGGGLVLRGSIPGDFDASVSFRVSSPQRATTFELAAIAVDPGRTKLDPASMDGEDANLCYDVHGAPPYASSERDEADGFRFGWNCASNLTRIDAGWVHESANMYNQYSRDVGDGAPHGAWSAGQLRLVRRGQLFATYFMDHTTPGWVCSGAGLVSTMPHDAFLRLAAKHWRKGGIPPANEVVFSDFVVRQA